jgi:uncharacterized repeat protein (TIGR03803 family)
MTTRLLYKSVLGATLALTVASAGASYAQTYTDLFNFDGIHGASPQNPGILAQGRDGNLYGTTPAGDSHGFGVVFRITPTGTARVLHDFKGSDGANPGGGLTLGTDGNFYGTTHESQNGYGTIFKITPNGVLTTLHFLDSTTGQTETAPIQATDGNFYGTAGERIYRIAPSGSFAVLAQLPGNSESPLVQATDGSFYGTTYTGGRAGFGTIFRMATDATVTVEYNLNAKLSGAIAPLIQASDGSFYGTTNQGGSGGYGTVFQILPHRAFTVLHNFPDPEYPNDGADPIAGLVQASDGNFYGVTFEGGAGSGVAFEITATGAYSILYNFDSASGALPASTPMQHTNGRIYGLTLAGGTDNYGVVYSLDLGLPPFVRLVPASGRTGKMVGFLGQDFTGTTAVSFSGIAATFNVESDTYLTATIPTGATTGTVSVTTPSGVLNSNQAFQVKP